MLCGNSLSGETTFAYRIGSFYNNAPNGLRRGVIRDVQPEQTPVPVLANRMRDQTQALLGTENATEDADMSSAPVIVEVPQWLARLEPKLAALKGDIPPPPQSMTQQPAAEPDDGHRTQQTLF